MEHLFRFKDFVVLLLVTIGVVVLTNIATVSTKIFQGNDVLSFSQSFISESVSEVFTKYASLVFTPNLLTVLFWGLAGLGIYVLTEGFLNGFGGVKDALKVDLSYRHPDGYSHTKYWTLFILKIVFYVGVAMVFALWTYLFFTYFIPFSSSSVSVMLSTKDIGEIFIFGLYSLLGVYTGLMGYLVYWRIYVAYHNKF